MYWLNKIVWMCADPFIVGMILLCIGTVVLVWGRFRCFKWILVCGFVWLWLWSSNVLFFWQQENAVDEFPPRLAESMPMADAIVVLGGGMGINTNLNWYAEINSGADRAWHAARLWKAGRAPIVIPSGYDAEFSDTSLLRDLGVPKEAICPETHARNTEENAKLVAEKLGAGKRILLVTSVWHMKRSLLMFAKYAPSLEVIPAAADYENRGKGSFGWMNFYPSAGNLGFNCCMFHELVGYYWYKWFR